MLSLSPGRTFTGTLEKATYEVTQSSGDVRRFPGIPRGVIVLDINEIEQEAYADLSPGDYLMCGSGSSVVANALARVALKQDMIQDGKKQGEAVFLDIPFWSGDCGTTFSRVRMDGDVDDAIITKMGYSDADKERQSILCPPLTEYITERVEDIAAPLRPITCEKPLGEIEGVPDYVMNNSVIKLQCMSEDAQRLDQLDPDGLCWVRPHLSTKQRTEVEQIAAALKGHVDAGHLGSDPIFEIANEYDETRFWSGLRRSFDGFGMAHLDPIIRTYQREGLNVFNSVTASFLWHWRRTSRSTDSDGDRLPDLVDPCPFTPGASCPDEVGPLFRVPIDAGASAYTNRLVRGLIPNRKHEFTYNGGFWWAVRAPMRARAKGLMWHKASDERFTRPVVAAQGPNLITYPGVHEERVDIWTTLPAAVGTRDTLPILNINGVLKISEGLPIMLPSSCGSYEDADCNPGTDLPWDFSVESAIYSGMIDLENDAYLAIARTQSMGELPYGSQYELGGASQSVCTFHTLLRGGTFEEALTLCGDFIEDAPEWGR